MKTRVATAVAGLLLCGSAFADCEMRDATPAENAYKARAEAALSGALPTAPAAWTMKSRSDNSKFQVCKSDGPGEFAVGVVAEYTWRATKEESDRLNAESRKLRKEIDNLRELPPEVKKERQVWLDKMSEANRASNAAYKAGDKALAKQKDTEAEGYSTKGRAVRDAYWASVAPKVAEIEARLKVLGDSALVTVRLDANERYPGSLNPDSGKPFIAGKVPTPKPGLKVQGVRLVVEGPAHKRGEIEAAVDSEKLKRLVQ